MKKLPFFTRNFTNDHLFRFFFLFWFDNRTAKKKPHIIFTRLICVSSFVHQFLCFLFLFATQNILNLRKKQNKYFFFLTIQLVCHPSTFIASRLLRPLYIAYVFLSLLKLWSKHNQEKKNWYLYSCENYRLLLDIQGEIKKEKIIIRYFHWTAGFWFYSCEIFVFFFSYFPQMFVIIVQKINKMLILPQKPLIFCVFFFFTFNVRWKRIKWL